MITTLLWLVLLMGFTRDVNWNGTNTSDSGGTVTASGTGSANGGLLTATGTSGTVNTTTGTTPSGWTALNHGTGMWRYFRQGTSLSTLVWSYTGGTGGPVNLNVAGYTFTNTCSLDVDTVVQAGTSTAPLTAASGTLNATAEVFIADFDQRRASATAPTFSAPTNGFSQVVTQGQTDGTLSLRSATYDLIVSANTGFSCGVTASGSFAWEAGLSTFKDVASTFPGRDDADAIINFVPVATW